MIWFLSGIAKITIIGKMRRCNDNLKRSFLRDAVFLSCHM